jgi:hypothetical protein
MPSTVAPVKAALYALLAATLTDAQVIYGQRPPLLAPKAVAVGNVRGENTPAGLGTTRPTYEDYAVDVVCSVSVPGATHAAQVSATEGALALYSAAELAVRGQATENLGVTGVAWARPLGVFELVESDDPDVLSRARNAQVRFEVQVRARTTL